MTLPDFLLQNATGSIHLKSHRIGLEHVVRFYQEGYSAEGILDQFPSLSLALIHKVIAFYLEHRPDVDAYLAQCHSSLADQAAAAHRRPDMEELRRRHEALKRSKAS